MPQHQQDSDDVRQEVGNGFRNVSWMLNYLFDLKFMIDFGELCSWQINFLFKIKLKLIKTGLTIRRWMWTGLAPRKDQE